MKNKLLSGLLLVVMLFLPWRVAFVVAQTAAQNGQSLQPIIQVDTTGEVDKSIIFDASKTICDIIPPFP